MTKETFCPFSVNTAVALSLDSIFNDTSILIPESKSLLGGGSINSFIYSKASPKLLISVFFITLNIRPSVLSFLISRTGSSSKFSNSFLVYIR